MYLQIYTNRLDMKQKLEDVLKSENDVEYKTSLTGINEQIFLYLDIKSLIKLM